MNTTTLQRSRFAHHAAEALTHLVAAPLRFLQGARTPVPALSAADCAAREAQAVRDMARRYLRTEPGFAADLAAAADRHERQNAE